jgi:DNA-binding FadR family transcriptional regulator
MPSATIATKDQQDPRVTARLIGRIKRLIADGSVAPGSKFPPEREMAKEFGANRASVRQALKVLEMMGVLSQRVGDGTYLSDSAETILNEPIDFLVLLDDLSHYELFETRLIVEPELAARAAERATAEDISVLRNAVLALERSKVNRDRLEADMAFHNAIFHASGNRICQLLFKGIHRHEPAVGTGCVRATAQIPSQDLRCNPRPRCRGGAHRHARSHPGCTLPVDEESLISGLRVVIDLLHFCPPGRAR